MKVKLLRWRFDRLIDKLDETLRVKIHKRVRLSHISLHEREDKYRVEGVERRTI